MSTQANTRQKARAAYTLGQLRRACGSDGSLAAGQFAELLDTVSEKGCDLDAKASVWPLLLGALPPWASSTQQQALKDELGSSYACLLQECQDKEQRLLRLVMCSTPAAAGGGDQTPALTTPLAVTVEQGGLSSHVGGGCSSTAGMSQGAATDVLLPDTESLLHELQGPDDEEALDEPSIAMTPQPSMGGHSSGLAPVSVSTPGPGYVGGEDSLGSVDREKVFHKRHSSLVSPLVSHHSGLVNGTPGKQPPGTPVSGKRARGFRSCHEYSYSLPVFPSPEKLVRPHLRSSSVGQGDAQHLEQAEAALQGEKEAATDAATSQGQLTPTAVTQTCEGLEAATCTVGGATPGRMQTAAGTATGGHPGKHHQRVRSWHQVPGHTPLLQPLPVITSNVDSDSCHTSPCGTPQAFPSPRTPAPAPFQPSPGDIPCEAPYTESPRVPRTGDPPRHAHYTAAGSRFAQMPKLSHEWHGALVSEATGAAADVSDALRQFWEAQRLIVVDCVRTDFHKNSLTAADALSGWLSAALADNKLYQKYQAASQQAWAQVTWLSSLARTALEHATHFSAEQKRQVVRLIHLLSAYSVHDPDVGYCQGMSDLALPFLLVMEDDGMAFWCFERLMSKVRRNFTADDQGILQQLTTLSQLLQQHEPLIHQRLQQLGAVDCHFAYRMIVVLLRRELPLEQALKLWEMLWADDLLSAYPEYQSMVSQAQPLPHRSGRGFMSQPGGSIQGTLPFLQFPAETEGVTSSGPASPSAMDRTSQSEQPQLRLSSFFRSRWGLGAADDTPSKSESGWRDSEETPCSQGVRRSLPMLGFGSTSASQLAAASTEGQSENTLFKKDGTNWLSAKFKGLRDSLTGGGATGTATQTAADIASEACTQEEAVNQPAPCIGATQGASSEDMKTHITITQAAPAAVTIPAPSTTGMIVPSSTQGVGDASSGVRQTKPSLRLSLDTLLRRSQPGEETVGCSRSAAGAAPQDPAPVAGLSAGSQVPAEEPASPARSCCSVVNAQNTDSGSSSQVTTASSTTMAAQGGTIPEASAAATQALQPLQALPEASSATVSSRPLQAASSGLLSRFATFATSKGLSGRTDAAALPPPHPPHHQEQTQLAKWGSRLHASFNILSGSDGGTAQVQAPDGRKAHKGFNASELWAQAAVNAAAGQAEGEVAVQSQSSLKSTLSAPVCSSGSGHVLEQLASKASSNAGEASQAIAAESQCVGGSGQVRQAANSSDQVGLATACTATDNSGKEVQDVTGITAPVTASEATLKSCGEERTGLIQRLFSKQPSKPAGAGQEGAPAATLDGAAGTRDVAQSAAAADAQPAAPAEPSLLQSMLNSLRASTDAVKLSDAAAQPLVDNVADHANTVPDRPWSLQRLLGSNKGPAAQPPANAAAAANGDDSTGVRADQKAAVDISSLAPGPATHPTSQEPGNTPAAGDDEHPTAGLVVPTAIVEQVIVCDVPATSSQTGDQPRPAVLHEGGEGASVIGSQTAEKPRGVFSLLSRLGQKQEDEPIKPATVQPTTTTAATGSNALAVPDSAPSGRLIAGITSLFGRKDMATAVTPAAATPAPAMAAVSMDAAPEPAVAAAAPQQAAMLPSQDGTASDMAPASLQALSAEAGSATDGPQEACASTSELGAQHAVSRQLHTKDAPQNAVQGLPQNAVQHSQQDAVQDLKQGEAQGPQQDALQGAPPTAFGNSTDEDVQHTAEDCEDEGHHSSEQETGSVIILDDHPDQLLHEDLGASVPHPSTEQEAQSGHVLAGWVAHWAAAPSLGLLLYFIAAVVALAGRRQLLDSCHDADDVHQLFRNPAVLKLDVSECAKLARQYRQAATARHSQHGGTPSTEPGMDGDAALQGTQDKAVSEVHPQQEVAPLPVEDGSHDPSSVILVQHTVTAEL